MKIITFWVPIFIISFFAFKLFIGGEKEFERHNIKIDKSIKIDDLFITKITVSEILRYREKDAILKIRGNIYYHVDFNKINFNNKKYIIINKPTFDTELDEKKTGIFMVKKDGKLDDFEVFNYSERASEEIKSLAENPKNMSIARKHAEEFIIGYLKQFDYTVNKVYWRDLTKENLSKETLKDINFDVLSKLVLCNESNNNTLKEIDLKYTIERNGGIDPLILSKDVDKKFGDCVENSLKEIKHEEYYGKEEKIEKSFNLDKDKICKKLRKKESWLNSNSEKLRKLNCKEEIE